MDNLLGSDKYYGENEAEKQNRHVNNYIWYINHLVGIAASKTVVSKGILEQTRLGGRPKGQKGLSP